MLIGYARVSTAEQNLDLQKDALRQAGCERIIEDVVSGSKAERPGLTKLREQLRHGDTLVVWRLDRLGRSLRDLIDWIGWFEDQGVAFRSLKEAMDTSTPGGKLVFHVFGAMAEFERNLIRERTQAGLAAARARGRKGGRPPAINKQLQQRTLALYDEKKLSIPEICKIAGISRSTLYKYVRESAKTRTV